MDSDKKGFGGRPPMPRGGEPPAITLTDAQKKTIQEIFGKYNIKNLTSAQAKEIFKSLESAGIKGPAVFAAVKEAGVDADKFFTLSHDGEKFPPPGGRMPPPDGKGPQFPPRKSS